LYGNGTCLKDFKPSSAFENGEGVIATRECMRVGLARNWGNIINPCECKKKRERERERNNQINEKNI